MSQVPYLKKGFDFLVQYNSLSFVMAVSNHHILYNEFPSCLYREGRFNFSPCAVDTK